MSTAFVERREFRVPGKERCGELAPRLNAISLYTFLSMVEEHYGITQASPSVLAAIREAVKAARGCPVTAGRNLTGKAKLYAQYAAARGARLEKLAEFITEASSSSAPKEEIKASAPSARVMYNAIIKHLSPQKKHFAAEMFPGALSGATSTEFSIENSALLYSHELEGIFSAAFENALRGSWTLACVALCSMERRQLASPECWKIIEDLVKTWNRVRSSKSIVFSYPVDQVIFYQLDYLATNENYPNAGYKNPTVTFSLNRGSSSGVVQMIPNLTQHGQATLLTLTQVQMAERRKLKTVGCPIRFIDKPHSIVDKISELAMVMLKSRIAISSD